MAGRMRIGIVCSEFNFDITQMMLERAKEHAKFLEVDVARVVMAPGVYDIPLAVKLLLKDKGIDGVVTIGAVIECSPPSTSGNLSCSTMAEAMRRISAITSSSDSNGSSTSGSVWNTALCHIWASCSIRRLHAQEHTA